MNNTPKKIANYTILKTLGRGGMGVVYLVKDEINNDLCALKIISPEHLSNEDSTVRFRREFRAMQQLSHPNVVRVFKSGMIDQRLFFTMEVVKGIGVKKWLDQDSKYLPAELKDPRSMEAWPKEILSALNAPTRQQKIYDLVLQISYALAAIHTHHIVHRDLKPDNILVSEAGVVKIMDFGIAKEASSDEDSTSSAGMMIGTFKYISPEQALNTEQIDGRADLYSLGLIFYELLAGRHPFYSDTSVGYAFKHARAKPDKISLFNPYVNRDIEKIVLKLLRKDPSRRYGNALHLIKSLKKVLGKARSESKKNVRAKKENSPINEAKEQRQLLVPHLRAHEKESVKLVNMCARISKGTTTPVLFLIGANNVGKSHILRSLTPKAKDQNVEICIARVQQNSMYSLAPYTQLAKQLLKKQKRLQSKEWLHFFENEAFVLEYYIPELKPYLNKENSNQDLKKKYSNNGISQKSVLFHSLKRMLRLCVKEKNVLWVLDELDAADQLSLDFTLYFMQALLRRNEGDKNTGFILTVKEDVALLKKPLQKEIVQMAKNRFAARTLELKELTDQEVSQFCAQMLGEKSFPLIIAQKISDICEGNPGKIKEYFKACANYNLLISQNDRWSWVISDGTSGTGKIQSLEKLEAKFLPTWEDIHFKTIDFVAALEKSERNLLELIACYDGYLPVSLLQEIHLTEGDKLLDLLNALLLKELIQENNDGSYNIPSSVFRESLIQSIDKRQKENLHQKIAFSLISLSEKSRNKQAASSIAKHLFFAGRKNQALLQLKEAVKQALWNGTFDQAEEFLGQAKETLSILDPDEHKLQHLHIDFSILKLDLLFRRNNDGKYLNEAKKTYDAYWVVAQSQARIKILLHLARAHRSEGNLKIAIEKSHDALAIAEEQKLINYRCVIRRKLGDFYAQNGNIQRCGYHWKQALKYAESINEHHEIYILKSHLALWKFERGLLSEAEKLLSELIMNSIIHKENFRTIDYSFALSQVKIMQGNTDEAKVLLHEVLKEAKFIQQNRLIALSQLSLASLLIGEDQKVAADNYIRRSQDFFKNEQSQLVLCRAYLILAKISFQRQDDVELKKVAQKAFKLADGYSDYTQKIEAECYLAFLLAKDKKKEALLELSRLIELAAQSEMIRIQEIAMLLKLHILAKSDKEVARTFFESEFDHLSVEIRHRGLHHLDK